MVCRQFGSMVILHGINILAKGDVKVAYVLCMPHMQALQEAHAVVAVGTGSTKLSSGLVSCFKNYDLV